MSSPGTRRSGSATGVVPCLYRRDFFRHKERRYRCCTCRRTFSERYGTPLFRLKYPLPIVMLVLALLSHGCPLAAIVFAFGIDERTVASWQERVGYHAKRVQYQYVWHTVIGARRAVCWCRRKPKSAVPIPPTSSASMPPYGRNCPAWSAAHVIWRGQ